MQIVELEMVPLSLRPVLQRLYDMKTTQSALREGVLFSTKRNNYYYDTGTGKVIVLDDDTSYIFRVLFDPTLSAETFLISLTKVDPNAVKNLLQTIDAERLFQRPPLLSMGKEIAAGVTDTEQKVEQIILEVTEQCNFRCKYCVYSEDFSGNRDFGNRRMPTEIAFKAIDWALENSGAKLAITFYGGEPLLNFKLMKAVIERSQAKRGNKEIVYSFTSNMSLMTREIATYLAQVPNLYIMASIDGPRTVHDAYRVYANDAPTFEDSIGGLRILADAYAGSHMPVNINAVLTPPFGFEKLEQVNAYFESLDWLPATCHVNITYPSYGTCPGLDEYYDKITGNPKYALHGMFDRLGRIESETPFVLEWFVQHGIQMWSVHEGQQRIESHGDKLMNYIRFWQAAGESEKTSIRTRDRIRQIVSSGHFAGGFVPYGYRAVDKGRVNKRDQPVKDLEIDPEEAAWVREVFEKVANEGASGYAMARMLNDRGLCTRQGARFQSVNIRRMIRHEGYTGYLITKAARSEFIQELQIVDEKLFARANEVIDCRSKKLAQEKNIAAKTNNPTLLAGIVVCAHCGAKMSAFLHTDRYKLADGTIREKVQAKYNCYQRGQKLRACDGQSLYLAERVDAVVLEVVHDIFRRIQQEPYDRSIEQKLRQENGERERQKQAAEKKIKAAQYKQKRYEDEVIRCLDGQSRFSEEMLARLIAEAETEVRQAKEEYAELLRNDTTRATIQQIRSYYDEFLGWANEFDLATIPRKRAILGQLIEKVEVGKGYKVTVHLRMSYAQFLGIEGNGEIQVRKDVCA